MNNFNDIFLNPKHIFSRTYKSINEIKNNSIYILDTNVLLLPYSVGNRELDEIFKVYAELLDKGALYIPVQVAKEFAKNRPQKLSEIYNALSDFSSRINQFKTPHYPMLKHLDSYKEAIDIQTKMNVLTDEYKKSFKTLMSYIKSINWDDPISQMYSKLFSHDCVLDYGWEYEKLKEELEVRNKFNIPPAFKDKSKDDGGIGDYIIWKDILKIGYEKHTNLILVTGDEKQDWFHQSMGAKLFPRFELMQEYKESCSGMDFCIISLSELMELFVATDKEDIVNTIKIVEQMSTTRVNRTIIRKTALERADHKCQRCKDSTMAKFLELHHIKSLKDGGENTLENIAVLCPNCHRIVEKRRYENVDFIMGSPCEMSGQTCPDCKIGIVDIDGEGVRCPICNLYISA